MILTCPNCGTQYVVKDGAIPPQGRQVRCAACKHSWHQDPEAAEEVAPLQAPAPEPEAVGEPEEESIAEAAMIDPSSGPEAEERAYEESVVAEAAEARAPGPAEGEPAVPPAEIVPEAPPSSPSTTAAEASDFDAPPSPEVQVDDDFFSPFADRDYAEPRRRRPLLTVLIVLLLVAAIAARAVRAAPDPLASWNDGAAKQAIVSFVAGATSKDSPAFVAQASRIAVFDNDGTLWVEQPMYIQLAFALDRVRALAPQNPIWKTTEPFASILAMDIPTALAGGENLSSLNRRMSVRIHSSSRREGSGISSNCFHAARRNCLSQTGSRRSEMNASKAAAVNPEVAATAGISSP